MTFELPLYQVYKLRADGEEGGKRKEGGGEDESVGERVIGGREVLCL